MANRQQGDPPAGRGQRQQDQSASAGQSSSGAAGQSASGASGQSASQSASGAGAPSGRSDVSSGTSRNVSRSDQERQRSVSREPGMQAPTRGASGGMMRQGASLPAILTMQPGLLAGAFMANPFEFMRRVTADMDRVFEQAAYGGGELTTSGGSTTGRSLASSAGMGGMTAWAPQIETFRRGDEIVVRADLPGVRKEDIQIDVSDDVLTLTGERQEQKEERDEGFFRREQRYGTFYRAIPLPEGVDEEQIEARYDNGVLEVKVPMPKQREQRGRRVQIN
ncbi:MAG TPA: Hsp20/alpha crystallin family protein [Gemmatimonadaceae bacterium]|jgi:HSP20 family protein|nr:Hsp20/alpha crystallin family protein [Gemmatimonadaceae bacterium]